MITWMQRHKKWLVITIWISTIAFVGAGFVGWGSYDYGKQSGAVAVVGDREISVEEFQQEYSSLYDQYARLFGTSFNEEMAQKLNLRDAAYQQAIQKNLILSYADSLGLGVTDEDIAKELVKYQAFLKDGKFDKETYIKVLNQNRMTPVVFEDSLKRGILLQKVQELFVINPTQNEVNNLSSLLFLENDIEYKIISKNDIKVTINDEDLKKYWEENKNSYMSETKYKLSVSSLNIESTNPSVAEIQDFYDKYKNDYRYEDGKIKSLDDAKNEIIKAIDEKASKKEALKHYLALKKGEENFNSNLDFDISKLPYSAEDNLAITNAKKGDILKPILHNNQYLVLKIDDVEMPVPLAFEEVKNEVSKAYLSVKKDEELTKKANEMLATFTGSKVNGITRDSLDKIPGLSAQEAGAFLNQMFSTPSKSGTISLENKVVLFKVLDSKFAKVDKTKSEIVKSTLLGLQDKEIMKNLIDSLKNTYEIQSSIQTKE